MKSMLRFIVQLPLSLASAYAKLLALLFPGVQSRWRDTLYREIQSQCEAVSHTSPFGPVSLELSTPNEVCRYRARTFSSKEPETLEWIERFGGEGTFFDVGANVGLYSIYYAKLFSGPVYAFEPSALNIRLLVENINANNLSHRITVVANPLSAQSGISDFALSMSEEGGSMSTFGESFGFDGEPLSVELRYNCVGFSLDELLESALIPDVPRMIKIDVDGIEHLILKGARKTLIDARLSTVLVEVNSNFHDMARETSEILTSSGFELVSASHAEMFDSGEFAETYNQVWSRP